MRSLFIKIFLWLWLAMALFGAIGVVLALTTDSKKASMLRHQHRLAQQSRELIAAFETRGPEGLQEKTLALDRKTGGQSFLFRNRQGPLTRGPIPPKAQELARQAARSGETEIKPSPRGIWVAMPAAQDYIFVTEAIRPGRLERLLNPYRLTPRLAAAFLVTGLVAYLLARSLTAPIGQLRRATQQFAAGHLATRVRKDIRGRDEIADLAEDFDRMAEHIEELVGSQKRLLRDISHELRSPLARLNVALALARQKSGAEAGAPLDRIEREAERLNDLIGQLLTLTQLESGAERLEKSSVDLQNLVHEIAADADFEARSVNRRVRVEANRGAVIQGSEELLRRAIENVVRNAVRYTAENSTVEIVLERRTEGGADLAVIRVRDHGQGVPEAALEKLFLPFYRAEDARDRQSGGTGIGLTIAERAVRLHGGRVSAANAPEGGLAVNIELPAGHA